jgi:hypothetical protein
MVGEFLVGAAAGLGVALLSSAAFAAIHPLGNLDPPNSSAFSEPLDTGPILSVGTFTLTKIGTTDASSTTIAVTHASERLHPGHALSLHGRAVFWDAD